MRTDRNLFIGVRWSCVFERREQLIPNFTPWAESVDHISALQRFAAGDVVKERPSVSRAVRNILKAAWASGSRLDPKIG